MKFHATFFSNSYEFLSESKQFHLMVVFERHLSHKLREAKKKNQNWPMKVSITFFSLIYQKLLMQIGKQGPGNHGGEGVVPPRIRDLYSEKNSKIFFLFIRTPLDKNHSKAPG